METNRPPEVRLRDPLSEVTRKERRSLLVASIIGIAIAKSGLIPSKISALGIEFGQTDQRSLLMVMAFVTLYFLAAFIFYAASDLIAWRLAIYYSMRQGAEEDIQQRRKENGDLRHSVPSEKEAVAKEFIKKIGTQYNIFFSLSRPISFLRAVFEFILPLAVGIYAVVILFLTKAPNAP
ncbi:MAG: hypothetical protein ABSB32_16935 [Thermodesulfobacteriota bacterium]|jgi:hypothetical protein